MRRSLVSKLTSASLLLVFAAFACVAQIEKPSPTPADDKAETIVQRALRAMGGDR